MDDKLFRRYVIVALIVIFAVLAFLIIMPFISAILIALVLAYIFYPLYKKVVHITKKPTLTALLFCLFIFIVIAIPLWFLTPEILRQTFEALRVIQDLDLIAPLKNIAPGLFVSEELTRDITVMINQGSSQLINVIMNRLGDFVLNLPNILLQGLIMIVIFFFSLKDGDKLIRYLKESSPLKEKAQKRFVLKFKNITRAVIINTLFVGVLQGLLAGIGFYIFGAPAPLFLAVISIFFAILPIVGPWLVWAIVAIGMLLSGNIAGLYLIIYGLVFVELSYQLLVLYVFKRVARISPAISLIGVLGGLYLFGVIGIVIGPLVLSYIIMFFEFYKDRKMYLLFGTKKENNINRRRNR